MATSHKDRGKWAEKQIHAYLKQINAERAEFDFLRLPDAKSSMGRSASMPADFEFFAPKVHGLLEVKEVDHEYRLPYKNLTQLPSMKKRAMAGGACYVLVYHTPIKAWRRINAVLMPDITGGSWDFREITNDLDARLEHILPVDLLLGK